MDHHYSGLKKVNMRYLLMYASIDGQTKKIANRIKDRIEAAGHELTFVAIEQAPNKLAGVDCLIIGSRIRFGHHDNAVLAFVKQHHNWIKEHFSAFFSVSLVARKKEKTNPQTNRYCQKFFEQSQWQPTVTAVFGGKLDYSLYNFWQKRIIRFIMWLTNGPTDFSTRQEFTNWEKVDKFAQQLILLAKDSG